MNIANFEAFFLESHIGEQMIWRLQFITLQPKRIVVAGFLAEHWQGLLKQCYVAAEIVTHEIVSLPDQSVDLIFANLFLPWCEDRKTILEHWRRILRPNGLILFSDLGPDTLIEVQNHSSHILPTFIDMHDLGDELIQVRFADPVLDAERMVVTYQDNDKLVRELQITNKIAENLSELHLLPNEENVFPLTYEIIYGHAWGPDLNIDHVADETGVVKIPLSHLRRI